MLRLKETMNQYFSDENEKHKADLPLAMLFQRFPDSEVRLKTAETRTTVKIAGFEHPLKSGSRLPSTAAIPELFYKCLSLFGLQGRRNPGVTLYTCSNPASLFCCYRTAAELNQKS